MKKFKVYHLQRKNERKEEVKPNGWPAYSHELKLLQIAEYETTGDAPVEEQLKDVWECCNVDCWDSGHDHSLPVVHGTVSLTPDYANFKGYCNEDIIIEHPAGIYKPDFVGFREVADTDEAMYRIIWGTPGMWDETRNKADFDEKRFDEVIAMIKREREEQERENAARHQAELDRFLRLFPSDSK